MKHDVLSASGGAPRRLLLVELNEVNFDVAKAYLDGGLLRLPGFEKLFERGVIRTSAEAHYEQLEPWIQWVSVHSGLSYAEHGVFRLGDIVGSGVPQVFEKLEADGFSIGAISPMNTENRLARPAYFIPDPWTRTPSDSSFWSRKLTSALAQAVNDNASARLTPSTVAILLSAMGRFSSPRNWPHYLALALGSRGKPWRKALFLDLLLFDVHQNLWKRKRPDFSVLFLNAGAHIQHHYLFNSKALDQEQSNPDWYCESGQDPIAEMLIFYDRMLQDLLAIDGLSLLVATGLTQVAYDRVKFYYRLRDHSEFLGLLGVRHGSIVPLMTRDFVVHFDSTSDAQVAAERLGALRIEHDDLPVFGEIDSRGSSLFVTLTYPHEITDATRVMVDGEPLSLKEHVAFVAIKNGMHSATGFVVAPEGMPRAPADGSHVKNLEAVISDFFCHNSELAR